MSEEISEHQMVAAILAMDIDLSYDVMKEKPELDQMIHEIKRLKENRDLAINDKESRERRYWAMCTVFNLPVTVKEG